MARIANSRFQAGSGVFKCKSCGRSTRARGGDGAHVGCCEECFELAGYDNMLSDNGSLDADDCREVIRLAAFVTSHGGVLDDVDDRLVAYAQGVLGAEGTAEVAAEAAVGASQARGDFAYATPAELKAMSPEARASYRKARRAAAKARRKAG